jgi:uncharacterized membrane protein YeiH
MAGQQAHRSAVREHAGRLVPPVDTRHTRQGKPDSGLALKAVFSMVATLFTLLDYAAIAVFAATGALVASRKEMDIFGFALLATVTGIGGGTIRDLLLGRLPVYWVTEPAYLLVCLAVAALVFFTAHLIHARGSRYALLLWLDAVGLAFVAVLGAEKALAHGPLVAVAMGVITATFGGIVRDVLGGESPVILRREIYVTAALITAALYVLALRAGLAHEWAALAAILAGFSVRGLAIHNGWSLPAYKPRPGRRPEDVGY